MAKIIDMHTHIFPEDIKLNWDRYSQRDAYFKLLTDPKNDSLQKYANAEETLELADEAGIEKIVMQGWYWNDHELCKYHNDYMYEIINKYPDRFEAFASINPQFHELALYEVERSYERGFIGIGEMGPGANNFTLEDNFFLKILEAADYYKLAVNIHMSSAIGREFLGKDKTPIYGIYSLVESFPNLTIILAHLGGGLPFYELKPEIREKFANVYYDLAANPLIYEIRSIKNVANIVGADKVLFGSDFPLLLYPDRKREMDFKSFVEDIKNNGGLSNEEWTKIMWANGQNIISNARRK